MTDYESTLKCLDIHSYAINSALDSIMSTTGLLDNLGGIYNDTIMSSLTALKFPTIPDIVLSNNILSDFSLFSINTKLVEKIFDSARFYGFNNNEIKGIVEKEQSLIFSTAEDVLDLTRKSPDILNVDRIQNYIESQLAIHIISKLKTKRINRSKSSKKNIEKLADIASFIYYRIFLKNPPYVAT